ncbi:MAG: carbamoyl-phosphate synthase domain-containing protein, partial [Planctomycetota bacterium]
MREASNGVHPHNVSRDEPGRVRGRLALADGSVFEGDAFGATGRGDVHAAEVVFNTAMTGYQESLTDPSYAGQILVQTTPLIGNTGVNPADIESARVQVSGFVVHELTRRHSNYRATNELSAYLAEQGVLGLAGVDTRALTRRLREHGVVQGVLTDRADLSDAELVALAREAEPMAGKNLVADIGGKEAGDWDETLGAWRPRVKTEIVIEAKSGGSKPLRVVALDCGAKRNILRHLTDRGCQVRLVPADTPADELVVIFDRGEADGLFISNGP